MRTKKKLAGVLLMLLVAFSVLFSSRDALVFAEDATERTDIKITEFKITNIHGKENDSYVYNETLKLNMTWDASAYSNTLKKGDYFTITLPDKFKFPTNHDAVNFKIYDPSGTNVVATAAVSPKSSGGGTVKVSFTEYVENRHNIRGTVNLQATLVNVKFNEENTFTVIAGSHTSDKIIKIDGPVGLENEFIGKWGTAVEGNDKEVQWIVRINHMKSDLKHTVITDSLSEDGGNLGDMKYIPESFVLWKVRFSEFGGLLERLEKIPLEGKLVFSDNDTKFRIDVGDLGADQYRLEYRTTYLPGTTLRNRVAVQTTDMTQSQTMSFRSASSSGTGFGDLNSKIKIIKVDAEENEIRLADAIFQITRLSDGKTYELRTDSQGEAVTEKLIPGEYKIKEKQAPFGYMIGDDELVVKVSSGSATIETISNTPIKLSVEVNKQWVGKPADAVTVHLYADDQDTGKSAVLNAANGWTNVFDDLRKYTADGEEIKYTIREDAVEGYAAEISGDAETGFTVKNVNTEKRTIPVTKEWVGRALDEVEIKLLADGRETATATLNAQGGWKHEFKDLPKYDAQDGHEIAYTILEVKASGYDTEISGDAETGFTVTNTEVTTPGSGAPKTGDDDNVVMSIVLALFSAGSLILIRRKRRERC